MELRLLGPVELWSAGARVDLGTPKQRCVLAVLAWSAGTAVPLETLIDHVWDDAHPRDARGVLYTYITRLRRVLGAAAGREPTTVLRRESAGYVLDIDRDTVDAHSFRTTTEAARRAADDLTRAELLREALALWRGAPLSGITGQWADSVRTSLEELRLNALGDRIDLDLRSGRSSTDLIDELTCVLAEHPLAERFAGQLMLVLYRSGRSAEALTVFERVRKQLDQELGSDPAPELQRLHRQVLRRDPALQPEARPVSPPDVPRQLPIARTTFVGRETEFEAARNPLTAKTRSATAVVAIYGTGGVGKSALALRVAHDVSEHYPDGHLYVDLHGASPGLSPLSPLEALGRFLRALGVSGSGVPHETDEAAAKLRSLLAERRVLLVLDNAADTSQVRPLLPANPACGAIVTSRSFLSALGDVNHIGLAVLPPDASVSLLAELDATGRLAADSERASQLAVLCDHLPLALRITAARVTSRPDWPLTTFVERLTDQQHRLDRLGHDNTSVRACFEVSYRALQHGDPSDQISARAFRLLGLPDGPDISLPIAARLLDASEPQAEMILDRLVDAQLLDSPAPDRYRMHDLLRLYARELAQRKTTETDRYRALERIWRCYVSTAAYAAQIMRPGRRVGLVKVNPADTLLLVDHRDAQEWLEDESTNLVGAARQAAAAPGQLRTTTVHLAHALFGFMHVNARWRDLRDINLMALQVAQTHQDRSAEAQILSDLGVMAWRTGDGDEAVRLFEESLAVRRRIGDDLGQAFSLLNLGIAHGQRGDLAQALGYLEEALDISRGSDYRSGEALALETLARVWVQRGDPEAAVAKLHESLVIYRELEDALGEAFVLRRLGEALLERKELSEAIACFEQALALNKKSPSSTEEIWNLAHLGEAHRRSGDPRRSVTLCEQALTLSRQVGAQQEHALALWRLGNAVSDLGDATQARALWREALPIFERLGAPEAADVKRCLNPGAPDSG